LAERARSSELVPGNARNKEKKCGLENGIGRSRRGNVKVLQRPKPALVPCRRRPSVSDTPMKAIFFKGSGEAIMQYARNVQFQVKVGKEKELNSLFEKEVLPILRKQNGFQEEVTLVNPKGAHFISLWDNRKNAETYETATYPSMLAKLNEFIVGTPRVETYETASIYARA
jgi:hypothetical protein